MQKQSLMYPTKCPSSFTKSHCSSEKSPMGWLRLVGSLKLYVILAEYSLFSRALLQKRPTTLRSLLIVATPYLIAASWHLLNNGFPGDTPKEPYVVSKEPYVIWTEAYLSQKKPNTRIDKIIGLFCKILFFYRSLLQKRPTIYRSY